MKILTFERNNYPLSNITTHTSYGSHIDIETIVIQHLCLHADKCTKPYIEQD
jgi:hypothetical protein